MRCFSENIKRYFEYFETKYLLSKLVTIRENIHKRVENSKANFGRWKRSSKLLNEEIVKRLSRHLPKENLITPLDAS